ncbi:MAG: hypothetical protein Q8Q13_01490 [bacterium]|nr:hypothetical protein [bacterium]
MNEKMKPHEEIFPRQKPIFENAEKFLRLIVAAPLIGHGSPNAISPDLERDRVRPPIDATLNIGQHWQKIGGIFERFNIWISDKALEFLNKNSPFLDAWGTGIGTDILKDFKEIQIDMSPFQESTIVFIYFNKDGNGGKRVQIQPTGDGKYIRYEYKF